MSRPGSTAVTAAAVTTAIPRAANVAWKRARNTAGKPHRLPQAVLDREQELDAAGAGADQRHGAAAFAREHARLQRLEATQESVDRLDRNGMLACARDARGVRRRADIEREEIVGNRRARAADYATAGEIELDRLILIEPCAGEAGERTGIDMRVVEPVMAGDEAGQHPGIGRVHLAGDQRETHAGDWLHPEHAQHGDVRVAGADQHHVLEYGMAPRLHAGLSAPTRRPIAGSLGASDRRVGIVSMRNRRRRPREKASTAIDSSAVTRISTTATSSLNSEMAASM